MEKYASVVINEVESAPLGDYVIDFLSKQKKECPYLDFKLKINVAKDSDFPEIVKDMLAFSNYGGGWILIGWQEEPKNNFIPVGLSEEYVVDQAALQEKFNSFIGKPLEIGYREFHKEIDGNDKRLAVIFIPPSNIVLKPTKDGKYVRDSKEKIVFKAGELFYRRGTQSIRQPSDMEIKLIENRLVQENYRLSILSGEPDKVDEDISSNLFEVTKMPKRVYYGTNRYDSVTIKTLLKQKGVFPEFRFKFKQWDGKLVTFENLEDPKNPYTELIQPGTATSEPVEEWMTSLDKRKLIIELLNREIVHYAIFKGLFYSKEHEKLFYAATDKQKRHETWKSQYRESKKSVAAQMYAEQLSRYVFCHPAFYVSFLYLDNKAFLKILPTFIITEDGRNALSGATVGTIITRLSYNRYNSSYLNTILFWINKLGDGGGIKIKDYLEISATPARARLNVGIAFDAPSTHFRPDEDDGVEYADEVEEDD